MEKLEVFMRWLDTNGVELRADLIEFTRDGVCDGFGVRARQPLFAGTCVCRIPKTTLLSLRTSPIGDLLLKHGAQGTVGLTIALARELALGEESHWHGYLQILPRYLPLPVFWSLQHQSYLQGTAADVLTADAMKYLETTYANVFKPFISTNPKAFRKGTPSYADFTYAAALVSSRAFNIGQSSGDSMVPVADMFNHRGACEHVHIEDDIDSKQGNLIEHAPSITDPKGDREKVLEINLIASVETGEELFNTFGPLSNAALLCKYGFVQRENPFDMVSISWKIVQSILDIHVAQRRMNTAMLFWDENPEIFLESSEDLEFELSSEGAFNKPLMLRIYTLNCAKEQVKAWKSDNVRLLKDVNNADMEQILNMNGVCDIIAEIVKKRLCEYPVGTSIEGDEKMIATLEANSTVTETDKRRVQALIVRLGERRALRLAYTSIFDIETTTAAHKEVAHLEQSSTSLKTTHKKRRKRPKR